MRQRRVRGAGSQCWFVYSRDVNRRSFAGYKYEFKLRTDFYGEVYRATTSQGAQLELLQIDDKFSDLAGFSASLTTHGLSLSRLEHDNVVRTRRVGKTREGAYAVVTDGIGSHVTVEQLLQNSPEGLPQRVAAIIGAQFLQGLAAAHDVGLIHGAVHPRSVLIDEEGTVKLHHFAIGRALSMAIARDPRMRDSLSGYISPELGRGKMTTKAADVYSAGAVVFAMLSGSAPPGTLDISPAFERMIQRALDPSLGKRYQNASAFLENYLEALEDDRWPRAPTEDFQTYLSRARAKHGHAVTQVADPAELVDAIAQDQAQDGDGDSSEAMPDNLPSFGEAQADIVQPTSVESDAFSAPGSDPISELISLSSLGLKPGTVDEPATKAEVPRAKSNRPISSPRASSQPLRTPSAPGATKRTPSAPLRRPSAPDIARRAPSGPLRTPSKPGVGKRAPSVPGPAKPSTPDRPGRNTSENQALAAIASLDMGDEQVEDHASAVEESTQAPPASTDMTATAALDALASLDNDVDEDEVTAPATVEAALAVVASLGLNVDDDDDDDDDGVNVVAQAPDDANADGGAGGDSAQQKAFAAIAALSSLDDEDDDANDDGPLFVPAASDEDGPARGEVSAPPAPPSIQAAPPPSQRDDSEADSEAAAAQPEPPSHSADPVSDEPADEPGRAESPAPEKPARAKAKSPAPARPKPQPALDDADLAAFGLEPKRGGGLSWVVWILIAAAALGALIWVIRHQVDLREQAEEQQAREEAEKQAALRAFQANQPKSGTVVIDSEPDGAAVWMLLGRTPVDSQELPTEMVHQIRVEQDGFVSADVDVVKSHWTGSGESNEAKVKVNLRQGKNKRLKAAPPEPSKAARAGLPKGTGTIHVESDPEGAEVWLLVGFTPSAEIQGYADVEYTFKVRSDGHLPGIVSIKGKDWKAAGTGKPIERSIKLKKSKRR